MNNFIQEYKTKARNKEVTITNVIERCAYKAIKAKNPNKKEVFIGLLRRSFTPGSIKSHRPHPFYKVELELMYFKNRASKGRRWNGSASVETPGTLFGNSVTEYFTEEELLLWYDLLTQEAYWDIVINLRRG